LLLHVVLRLLESVAGNGWHQVDHLHLARGVRNFAHGIQLEESGEVNTGKISGKLGDTPSTFSDTSDSQSSQVEMGSLLGVLRIKEELLRVNWLTRILLHQIIAKALMNARMVEFVLVDCFIEGVRHDLN
jgi:hypothetical protein